jgi:hypothetical protein
VSAQALKSRIEKLRRRHRAERPVRYVWVNEGAEAQAEQQARALEAEGFEVYTVGFCDTSAPRTAPNAFGHEVCERLSAPTEEEPPPPGGYTRNGR